MDGMVPRIESLESTIRSCVNADGTAIINYSKFDEMLGELERFPMTPDILRASVLGKWINDIRKTLKSNGNNKDKAIVKRLRSLVQKWSVIARSGDELNSSGARDNSTEKSPAIPPPVKTSPALQKVVGNGINGHVSSPASQPPSGPGNNSPSIRTGGIVLKLPNAKRKLQQEQEKPAAVPQMPTNKRLRGLSTVDSRSNSPSLIVLDSNSRDGISNDGEASNLSVPSPASMKPRLPTRKIEKVKSHQELLAEFKLANPDLPVQLPQPPPPPVEICDESRAKAPISSSSVIKPSAKDSRKSKKQSEHEQKPVEKTVEVPQSPPGRLRDPVEAELAKILEGLPPISASVEENDEEEGESSGEARSSLTEAYSVSTRTGETLTVLPYVFMPFSSD